MWIITLYWLKVHNERLNREICTYFTKIVGRACELTKNHTHDSSIITLLSIETKLACKDQEKFAKTWRNFGTNFGLGFVNRSIQLWYHISLIQHSIYIQLFNTRNLNLGLWLVPYQLSTLMGFVNQSSVIVNRSRDYAVQGIPIF